MKAHETRSHAHSPGNEDRMVTRKQKAEGETAEAEAEHSPKKAKTEEKPEDENGQENGKSTEDIKAEFENFCKSISEHLSIQQMCEILEANAQDSTGVDDAVVPRCQDILFYGPLDNCPVCGGILELSLNTTYICKGEYSNWSSCTYNTEDPPRRDEPIKLPDSIKDSGVANLLETRQDSKARPSKVVTLNDKPFRGMVISLARLTRMHQYWKSKIEKHGGKVANSIIGVNCLVVSPAERERGGASKLAEAMDKGIPIVREAWLTDSIEKKQCQLLGAYDLLSDLVVAGKGIPLYQQDASEEALETVIAELKVYGKMGVHKDTKLHDEGGQILEKDGILYNCAFAMSDKGRGKNEFCIVQLIMVPENRLYMYYRRGRIGDEAAEESLNEWDSVDNAIKEFAKQFQGLTGKEFEQWERERTIKKQQSSNDDGVEVQHGGLGLRQLGVAVAHCKLDPKVANFMKVLCNQDIYRYALMEMGLDFPDLPLGMVTDFHIKRCEEMLLEFMEKLIIKKEEGQKRDALCSDFSQKMFTLRPSTRPSVFHDFTDIADRGAASFETVRDVNVASRLIGDMSGWTIDDPLFDRYKKLGCSISPVENDTDDYKMVANYLEKTYEPVRVGEISYGVSIQDVFAVELSACPSLDKVKKSPNKVLLWCGTRSSNLLRHLQKGFLPAVCFLPVPGYMFGKAIVCSDAAAEAARYGFTAVDRLEDFLVLAVASLGENITELMSPLEDAKSLEEKKQGVMGLGRKKTEESEHLTWMDDIKVPYGKLIPSEHKDSPLEYNEYAVYDPQQVSIRFLVAVKFEEKDVVYDTAE